uniref:Uncharacterized protein n=1 Tax=Oryza sativa subsp. japonica TaxID=39947 RepID=Q8GVP7_ORYSJ|nr:hypothetical protein [Oryza sativa Japonica Group]
MATALCHAGVRTSSAIGTSPLIAAALRSAGAAGDWRFSDARPRLREVSALTAAETATDDILVASPDVVMTSVAGKMSWSTGERDVEGGRNREKRKKEDTDYAIATGKGSCRSCTAVDYHITGSTHRGHRN